MVAMLAALGLAIDVGNLYFSQRNLQKLASLAAIDAARVVSGCSGSNTVRSVAEVTDAVKASIANNGGNVDTLFGDGGGSTVELGRYDTAADGSYVFSPLAAGDPTTSSVRVTLREPAPARFIPVPGTATTNKLAASASAAQYPVGTFQTGETLLNLDTGQSALLNGLLTALLGTNVSLSVASYESLASVNLSIKDIGTAAGIDVNSNLKELLDTQVTLPGALNVLAQAVNIASGGTDVAASTLVSQLAALADPAQKTTWGTILGVEPIVEQVVTDVPFVDLLSLILALGESANQGTPLALPVSLNIPNLAQLYLFLTFADGMQPSNGAGRAGYYDPGTYQLPYTSAHQADVTLSTRALIDLSSDLLETGATVNLGLDVEVGSGSAALDSIKCPAATQTTPIANIRATTAGGRVTIGTFTGSAADLPPVTGGTLTELKVLGIGVLTIILNPNDPEHGLSDPILGDKTTTIQYTHFVHDDKAKVVTYNALQDSTNPYTFGSDQLITTTTQLVSDLLDCNNIAVMLLGANVCSVPLVAPVLSLVGDILAGVIGPLLDTIVDPLLHLLGIEVGAITVQMNNVSVSHPVVFSTTVPPVTN